MKYWMYILTWRALGYDDDGMEMYFTNPDTKTKVAQSPNQGVDEFAEALEKAKPPAPKTGPPVHTNIEPMLIEIMNEYMKAKHSKKAPKKKTIIILTDGAWQGMHDEHIVDNSLRSRLETLFAEHKTLAQERFRTRMGFSPSPEQLKAEVINVLEELRPVTLQFIRFGHDERGMERLRRLDDGLKGDPNNADFP